jgi:hypothetical protein
MSQLAVESVQWNTLKHIAEVKPIGDGDAECLEEVRLVLQNHNCVSRFGVSLLHSHFALDDDEMMLETTNLDKREHWVRPVKRSLPLDNTGQTTVVAFNERGYNQVCGCDPRTGGHHHK